MTFPYCVTVKDIIVNETGVVDQFNGTSHRFGLNHRIRAYQSGYSHTAGHLER